tara:strand:+ start:4901 stop:5173 length:273 start_codon:yes stop_codon:yes gene_type:complete
MNTLPSDSLPLDQHSLSQIERWLTNLGAVKSDSEQSLWRFKNINWSAKIQLNKHKISITWEKDGMGNMIELPYTLSRFDIQSAILDGPLN